MANSNNQHVCMSNVYDKFWCHKRESIVFIEKWHKPTMEDYQCTDYFKLMQISPNNNEFLWFSVKLVFFLNFDFFRMDNKSVAIKYKHASTNFYKSSLQQDSDVGKHLHKIDCSFKKHDIHKKNWKKKIHFSKHCHSFNSFCNLINFGFVDYFDFVLCVLWKILIV